MHKITIYICDNKILSKLVAKKKKAPLKDEQNVKFKYNLEFL